MSADIIFSGQFVRFKILDKLCQLIALDVQENNSFSRRRLLLSI